VEDHSGTVLNRTQYPSNVIALVVFWRLRYKLALRDLPEMFAPRGMVFSYEAVRDWEAKLTPALAEDLRRRPRERVAWTWRADAGAPTPSGVRRCGRSSGVQGPPCG